MNTYPSPHWTAWAACVGKDPNLFHPYQGDGQTAELAKRVCAGCPVADACLEHALQHHETGIWGGTSERQRRTIRRRRRAA